MGLSSRIYRGLIGFNVQQIRLWGVYCHKGANEMPPKQEPTVVGEWECMECGYIAKGVESRRPAECPECGASARALEFFADDSWDEEEDDDLDEEGFAEDEL